MSSVQPQPESVSRAGRLDQILRELLHQTPGVEAAAVVSFDGLPMASALPAGMDEDRVAAMSAALLSLAERAAQGLGRGDLSQVYIEGEHGTVFLVSAQDEGVLIAVTAAGAKVGMMLYEVKLAANRVGEVLHGPAPLPAPLPANVTRGYLDAHDAAHDAVDHDAPSASQPAESYEAFDEQAYTPGYNEPAYSEPAFSERTYTEPAYSEPSYTEPSYTEPSYTEPSYAEAPYAEAPYAEAAQPAAPAAENGGWSSYAPIGSVLPGEQGSWT
jgi:predicted regulator of Ras-like GTPase activity (Roadblock/LC7/MglB family)